MAAGLAARSPGLPRAVPLILVAALAALAAVAASGNVLLALVVALVPAVLLLAVRPAAAAVLGVGLVPFAADVVQGGPVRVSISDVLLALAVVTGVLTARRRGWLALRPMLPLLATYTGVLLLALVAHLDASALINGVQRLQILLVPLVVGAVLLDRAHLQRALSLYVLTATLLAVAWSADVLPPELAFQKNPVGQFIAGALLIIASDARRWGRLLALPPLAFGLLQTESRGALLGLLFGLGVLVVARPGADKVRTAALLVPFLLVLGLAYQSLPDDVQARTSTLSDNGPGAGSSGQYTIQIREAYRQDALRVIEDHAVVGVGIGNYLAGNRSDGTLTDDPHNVLLLEAAEGGVPLAAVLVVLIGGSGVLLWRRRQDTPLAALALAVQAATLGHGLVDVYWVRGTPVLGWLLVGAALADAARRRSERDAWPAGQVGDARTLRQRLGRQRRPSPGLLSQA